MATPIHPALSPTWPARTSKPVSVEDTRVCFCPSSCELSKPRKSCAVVFLSRQTPRIRSPSVLFQPLHFTEIYGAANHIKSKMVNGQLSHVTFPKSNLRFFFLATIVTSQSSTEQSYGILSNSRVRLFSLCLSPGLLAPPPPLSLHLIPSLSLPSIPLPFLLLSLSTSLDIFPSVPLFLPIQLVELKNGETYNGHLVNCDNWMNIQLKEVICTSRVRRK